MAVEIDKDLANVSEHTTEARQCGGVNVVILAKLLVGAGVRERLVGVVIPRGIRIPKHLHIICRAVGVVQVPAAQLTKNGD
jgi:hypothetical protein